MRNSRPASGALIGAERLVPLRRRPVDRALHAHATQTDRDFDIAQITAGDNDEGLLLAAVFAAKGYIVVAPNYVGYDISTLDYHPYLVASQQQSDDMIDALAAARSALPTASGTDHHRRREAVHHGVLSRADSSPMATHRAMQAGGMTVTAAAPLSGPYALSAFGG